MKDKHVREKTTFVGEMREKDKIIESLQSQVNDGCYVILKTTNLMQKCVIYFWYYLCRLLIAPTNQI